MKLKEFKKESDRTKDRIYAHTDTDNDITIGIIKKYLNDNCRI